MKKISLIVVITAIFFTFYIIFNNSNKIDNFKQEENIGVFISYIEFMKYFDNKDVDGIKYEIDKIIDNSYMLHFNNIYLQVRPFSDSIYKSNIFPYSHTISGYQGKILDIDVLDYFIKAAHLKNIKIHAWINPYRISNGTDISVLSEDNIAYKWLNTDKVKVIDNKGIFYNPASSEVIDLIVSGVEEIVKNYQVDSVLFDDYFYPESDTIDELEYLKYKDVMTKEEFRISKVNELIKKVYSKIKSINKNILFGISPDGNIDNNYELHMADIKTWLKEDNYIDYIMPQLYYGFTHEKKPFIKTLNEWQSLIENDVYLIPALGIYKSGSIDNYAKSGKSEWCDNTNIIKKQIQVVRNMKNYSGISIFRYDYFIDPKDSFKEEVDNYLSLF